MCKKPTSRGLLPAEDPGKSCRTILETGRREPHGGRYRGTPSWTAQQMNSRTSLDSAMYPIATLLLMSGAIHVAILAITGRSWMGPLSLRKPATFGLSFGLTLITLTWVSSFLRMGERTRARLLSTFAAACVLETALITVQAWRGVPSHFNVETTADAIVAQALAAGGAMLVVIVATLTLLSFRSSATPASMRVAIRTGFVLLMASMVTGGFMIAKGMRLVFQGNPQGAYETGGSLKHTGSHDACDTRSSTARVVAVAHLLERAPSSACSCLRLGDLYRGCRDRCGR
jgi:hypothetical protein